jgi:hypothetical protein
MGRKKETKKKSKKKSKKKTNKRKEKETYSPSDPTGSLCGVSLTHGVQQSPGLVHITHFRSGGFLGIRIQTDRRKG